MATKIINNKSIKEKDWKVLRKNWKDETNTVCQKPRKET